MGLDSAVFLLFLGCVAGVHAAAPARGRVLVLLGASLVFYAAASVKYLALMLCLGGLNYAAVQGLGRISGERRRTLAFAGAVAANLAALILFKYLAGYVGEILAWCGWRTPEGAALRLAVPLGLSYFTFQMLACVTDVYRQAWKPPGNFIHFLLFALFFPQISSGPIPRAERLWPQLAEGGCPTAEDRLAGLRLLAYGFFKKFVVANRLSEYVAVVFGTPPDLGTLPVLWGIGFNALYLYADFSGYVDIAIGSARFLGIRLDPNFSRPFTSKSVTELWRRWHMTLSFWLRDYLYLPLLIRIRDLERAGVVLALIITFGICGIWHGWTWNFFLFGLSQGLAMSVEFLTKSWRSRWLKNAPPGAVAAAGNIYTLGFFALTEVLFRATDLQQAHAVYSRLLHLRLSGLFGSVDQDRAYYVALDFLCVGLWAAVAFLFRRAVGCTTPWFVLLCVLLIVFLGRLGSGHFIYAAF